MPSDYVKDLVDHKQRVAGYMQIVANELFKRATVHDNSKFSPEEFDMYEATFSELQAYTYGSQKYKETVKKLGPAWSHHCQVNDHHPEYFKDGVRGMNLIQLVEMLCDWLAASERGQTDVLQSLAINKKKFHIDDQLFEVLKNTVKEIAPGKLPDKDPLV
ncbi:hypothetical protein KSF_099060 [Reticulibacter mediterranei]|uniref:Uncharacterized protein n=1 Tax=Reticulibacter mediterranei TaxID=2778369 RepID=A0A8J3ISW5_9CHLR|nr:DUF5662 family protein [Reticulibacter mediterranei]GHO99858.1 hypothetical protein KSF_099060 [Reticulibacter mediterranei]